MKSTRLIQSRSSKGEPGRLGQIRGQRRRSSGPAGIIALVLLLAAPVTVWPLAGRSEPQLWSWGANREAQLGDGGQSSRSSPGPVALEEIPAELPIRGIAAGRYHSVAWSSSGRVYVWGHNRGALLGLPPSIRSARAPVGLDGIHGVRKVSVGETHSVALSSDGTVWSWGLNSFGQLGLAADPSPGPRQVEGLGPATDVAAGRTHSLAATSDGAAWSWGSNRSGQLGVGDKGGTRPPVKIDGLENIVAVAAGGAHSVALAEDGTVWTWGAGGGGQLGSGNTQDRTAPGRVPGTGPTRTDAGSENVQQPGPSTTITAIAAGEGFTLAIDAEDRLWVWGFNYSGQLATGDTEPRFQPTLLKGPQRWTAVAAGRAHTLAVDRQGDLWSWGQASKGQLGNLNSGLSPKRVESLSDVTAVAAGAAHSLAVGSRNSPAPVPEPLAPAAADPTSSAQQETPLPRVPVAADAESTIPSVEADGSAWVDTTERLVVASGADHFVALLADSTVITWGSNTHGQLGDGTSRSHREPSRVVDEESKQLREIVAVTAGDEHSMALDNLGVVWSWGRNTEGQLGHGEVADLRHATPIPGLPPIHAIKAISKRSKAEARDGSLWVWGTQASSASNRNPSVDRVPKRVFP